MMKALAQATLSGLLFALIPGLQHTASGATILDPSDAPGVTASDYENLASLFPAVGRVNSNGVFDGSAVLIGDRWALTAGTSPAQPPPRP